MKELIISIGNGAFVSHGAGVYGKEIKEADIFLNSVAIDGERHNFTDEAIFITAHEDFCDVDEGHLLKELDLEDDVLYELNYHNYKDLIIVSKYKERMIEC